MHFKRKRIDYDKGPKRIFVEHNRNEIRLMAVLTHPIKGLKYLNGWREKRQETPRQARH